MPFSAGVVFLCGGVMLTLIMCYIYNKMLNVILLLSVFFIF